MPRLNIFDNGYLMPINNGPLLGTAATTRLWVQGVFIPGSISFNNVAVLASFLTASSKTLTVSFGLYSLNGSTLSLANSASGTSATNAESRSWMSLVTSATQDITPGNWYLGLLIATAGTGSFYLDTWAGNLAIDVGSQSGVFVRGLLNTTGLPTSIATSALSAEGSTSASAIFPYILISA